MQGFDFKLSRVLRLREAQVRTAQAALEQARASRAQLQVALDAANKSAADAGQLAKTRPWVKPAELATVNHFTARLDREAKQWLSRLAAQDETITQQEHAVTEARRHVRLLEMLRDRRRTEWQIEADRESAHFTADFIAAQSARSRRKAGRQP